MKSIYFYTTDITIKAGIERVTINLANYFVKKDIPVTIVSNFRTNEEPAYDFESEVKFAFLNEVKFTGGIGSLKRLKQFLWNMRRVKRYFSKIKDAIIIIQAFPNSFIFWLCCGKKNKNIVLTVEHVNYFYYGKLIRLLRYIVYKYYDNVVVLTAEDKACYDKLKIHTSVIPNGIVLPNASDCVARAPVICSIGRLDPEKKFDSLIRVFSKIALKYPCWNLEIYGTGSLQEELEELILNLNLTGRVFLKGVTCNVNCILQRNSIFVVTSKYEGFSIVLVEAMANGIACVSYNCPTGPREIVTDGHDGLLVENQNESALVAAIEVLINNQIKRKLLGKNATQSAKKYSIENIGNQWLALFHSNET